MKIKKGLVSEEAIRELGYNFVETGNIYYLKEYLRYVSVYLPPYLYSSCRPNLA